MEYKGITLTLAMDDKEYQSALKRILASNKALNNDISALKKALKLDPKDLSTYTALVDKIKRKMAETKEISLSLHNEMNKEYAKGLQKDTSKWANLNLAIKQTEKEYKDLENDLNKIQNDFENATNGATNFGNEIEKAGGLGKKSFDALTVAAGNLIASGIKKVLRDIVNSFKELAKFGMETETLTSSLRALYGDKATEEQIQGLVDLSYDLGKTSKYSANEVLQAMQDMAKAGYSAEDTANSIQAVLNLSLATGEDLKTLSGIVTDGLNAFGYASTEAARFTDVLTTAANETNVDVADLGESLTYVGAIAGTLGYEIEDVAIALAEMGQQGIKGSQAGTALRKVLQRLSNDTSGAAKTFKKLTGVDFFDKQTGEALQLNEVINLLRDSMAGLNDEQQQGYLSQLAGTTATTGLAALINADADAWNNLSEAVKNAGGSAKEIAEIMNDNIEGDIAKLEGSVQALALAFAPVEEPTREIIQKITDFINNPKTQELFDSIGELSGELLEQLSPALDFILEELVVPLLEAVEDIMTILNLILEWFNDTTLGKITTFFKLINDAADAFRNTLILIIAALTTISRLKHGAIGGSDDSETGSYRVDRLKSGGFGTLASGGYNLTLNTNFNVSGGLDESKMVMFADILTNRINENLGGEL